MKHLTTQECIEQAAKEGNYRDLAAYLNANAADLIKQILDKHMDTVLRELHEIVKQRKADADKLAKVEALNKRALNWPMFPGDNHFQTLLRELTQILGDGK